MPLTNSLFEKLRQRANYRCEYCHYPEILSSAPLSVEHIYPRSLGGRDNLENLALACRRCNERRYNFMTATDPETNEIVSLFNPRQNVWSDHFIWSVDALEIIGRTAIGRATCQRLDLNDDRRKEPFIKNARKQWLLAGFHPSIDDPRLSSD
jgi:5-methylcytosine-specific restriction endonuclease McrA